MTKIHLTQCDVISPGDLAALIAQTVVPSRSTFQGMDCIRTRTFAVNCPDPKNVGKVRPTTFEKYLTEAERAFIAAQLAGLPTLHGGMSEYQRADFLREFKKLNPKLEWAPVLRVGEDSKMEKESRDLMRVEQLKAIRSAIEAGDLVLVGSGHVPAEHAGGVLPIQQAKKYLERCGFEVTESHAAAAQMFGKVSHRNSLDAAIEEAVRSCKGSMTLAIVWPVLTSMAIENRHGLSYDSDDAASARLALPKHSISYEGSGGCIEKLTREALGKRLKRRAANLAKAAAGQSRTEHART